jgi:signal peptidase I
MLPALSDQDRVLVSRVAYRFNSPQRGDIVLLGKSVAGVEVVKRIIAMPGDLRPDESGKHPAPEAQADRLSADEYYVLGDNRAVSRDSRTFGPVKRSEVSGRVWYRYAPSSQAGRIGKDNG